MDETEKHYWLDALCKLNTKLDDIICELTAAPRLTLSQRITKLEEAMRRPGTP